MIKKFFKLLLIFSVLAVLPFSSITAFAADSTQTINRFSGSDRYATSAAIASNGWTQSNYAIIASGENFPDAISAAPLAKKYDAPILLSKTNSIPKEILSAIQKLKVKNIIIIGGTGSISSKVEKQLTASGLAVTRIFGQDRYETCIKIAEQLGHTTEIAVVTGESFPDALSISPIAAKRNMPIILVNHNEIPSIVKNYINNRKLTTTYVIGSGTSLNNAVLKGLSNIELITGNDKYQINFNIIDKFKSDLDLSTTYVASGEMFPDALSGSIFAGKNSNPLLLVGGNSSFERDYFNNNSAAISNINILGGTGVIPDERINKLIGKYTTPIVDQFLFSSTNLIWIEDNTATFKYKVLDKSGEDITKAIPESQIYPVASVSSSITLNPLTGVGTITLKSSSDADKRIIITLLDSVTGKVASFDSAYSQSPPTSEPPINDIGSSKVYKIEFSSRYFTKSAKNEASFKYKILDKDGIDITKKVLASDLYAISWIGSSSVPIRLNPQAGTGVITYNFSDTDEAITVQIACYNGIVGTATLTLDTLLTESNMDVSKIEILSPKLRYTGTNTATFQYRIIDEKGADVTSEIPVSRISAYASVSSSITLDPLAGSGTITFHSDCDADKPIIITLIHNVTDVSGIAEFSPLNSGIKDINGSPKIDKITILSSLLTVDDPSENGVSQVGYARLEVRDQYGNDITNSGLNNTIKLECSYCKASLSGELIIINPNEGVNLLTLKTISITATDTVTGVSTTKVLTIHKAGGSN
ncbi:MAG: cell wall-binding repeat-containing protein [Clostridium lundense]|nr:cell wall-binding repeat-containing protein [Clostridium lundense]